MPAKNKKTVYTIKTEDDGEKRGNLIGIKSSYVEYTKFKDNFSKETVSIEGANGETAINYDVFIVENAAGLSATTYKFTF